MRRFNPKSESREEYLFHVIADKDLDVTKSASILKPPTLPPRAVQDARPTHRVNLPFGVMPDPCQGPGKCFFGAVPRKRRRVRSHVAFSFRGKIPRPNLTFPSRPAGMLREHARAKLHVNDTDKGVVSFVPGTLKANPRSAFHNEPLRANPRISRILS